MASLEPITNDLTKRLVKTTLLISAEGKGRSWTGTEVSYSVQWTFFGETPVIVSNRHVFIDAETITVEFWTYTLDNKQEKYIYSFNNVQDKIFYHQNSMIDLAMLKINSLVDE